MAFVLYDTHMEQAVTQEGPHGSGWRWGWENGVLELLLGVCAHQGFMSAIEHHGFPISKAEARISGILEVEVVGRNMNM